MTKNHSTVNVKMENRVNRMTTLNSIHLEIILTVIYNIFTGYYIKIKHMATIIYYLY